MFLEPVLYLRKLIILHPIISKFFQLSRSSRRMFVEPKRCSQPINTTHFICLNPNAFYTEPEEWDYLQHSRSLPVFFLPNFRCGLRGRTVSISSLSVNQPHKNSRLTLVEV